MASFVRFTALAAMVSSIYGYVLEMPSQTVGCGQPFPFPAAPTDPPSQDTVQKQIAKRQLTNTCSQWTINDGFGSVPVCYNSETCLFTSATDGYLYEGCGQTSIAYNWVTECWPYPQIGSPPVSQIYCPASAPACGFYAFEYDALNTFYNFGCSITSYSVIAVLATNSTTNILAGGGTTQLTEAAPTVTVTENPSPTTPPNGLETGSATAASTQQNTGTYTSSSQPIIGSHGTKKTPIGAIVGGVVGGLIVIAAVFLLVWFLLRRSKTSTTQSQTQQQPITAAYQTQSRISELGGIAKPPTVYPPSQPQYESGAEKPLMNNTTQEFSPSSYGGTPTSPQPQSPPPIYSYPPPKPSASPQNTTNYAPSNFTELDSRSQGRQSVPPPVSPVGTNASATHAGASPGETHSSVVELGEVNAVAPTDVAQVSELGVGRNGPPPNVQEMSGTGGIAPARTPVRQSAVDMSGAPMSEDWRHELA